MAFQKINCFFPPRKEAVAKRESVIGFAVIIKSL